MSIHLLPAAMRRTMPWKNGGGSTTEVAIEPDGADLGAFDWRISMARVAQAGPFSSFPEIDRTLCVLDGEGLVLAGLGPAPLRLTQATDPHGFPADRAVQCTLIGGAVTDLNVMTRRGRYRHTVARLADPSGSVAVASPLALLLSMSPVELAAPNGDALTLATGDAVRIEGETRIDIRLLAGAGAAYLMTLHPAF